MALGVFLAPALVALAVGAPVAPAIESVLRLLPPPTP